MQQYSKGDQPYILRNSDKDLDCLSVCTLHIYYGFVIYSICSMLCVFSTIYLI